MQKNPLAFFFTEKELNHLFPTKKRSKLFLLISKICLARRQKNQKRLPKQVLILNELGVPIAQCQKRRQKNQNKRAATIKM
ncbi:TPA: hypothetical protein ACPO6G_001224 [Haemophilus influenzae]